MTRSIQNNGQEKSNAKNENAQINGQNKAHPFQQNRTGQWTITVDLDCGQAYRFRYLCDHQDWRTEFPAKAYATGPDALDAFVIKTPQ